MNCLMSMLHRGCDALNAKASHPLTHAPAYELSGAIRPSAVRLRALIFRRSSTSDVFPRSLPTFERPSDEPYSPFPYNRQSLHHRALMIHTALHVRDVGEPLNDDIRDEFPREIVALLSARIDERHVQDNDGDLFLARDDIELADHLLVVAPKPIQTFHHHRITACQPSHHRVVDRTVKILVALLVSKEAVC